MFFVFFCSPETVCRKRGRGRGRGREGGRAQNKKKIYITAVDGAAPM